MFTLDKIIDIVQESEKQFINTFVFDKNFKAELTKLVDTQAQFAKSTVTHATVVAESLYAKSFPKATSK